MDTKDNTLASEFFSRSNKNYFLDFKVAQNNTNYLQITRSDRQHDNTYKRYVVIIWQEDFHCLVLAFASLLQTAIHLDRQEVTLQQLYLERQARQGRDRIQEMATELRPREKLMKKGASTLSNAELLALLIGSGSANESAVSLGRKLMQRIGHDPARLAFYDMDMLLEFKGMGVAKSCAVLAAVEISRRMHQY